MGSDKNMKSEKTSGFLSDFVADHRQLFNKSHEYGIFTVGLVACLCAHISYLIMFFILGVTELVIFNVFSILTYVVLILLVRVVKDRSILIYISDVEIMIHAAYATHLLGWRPDFIMFYILIIPATFLIRTQRIYIPLIIGIVSLGMFVYFKITIDYDAPPVYVFEDNDIIKTLQFANAFIGVFVMFCASIANIMFREYMEFQLVDQRETFKELASIDPLTNLYNRRAMNETIKDIRRRCRTPKSKYVIGIGDIDDFKKVNDTYGHDVGDKVLVYVSNLLISEMPEGGYAARWGGEEFLFIIPESSIEEGLVFTEKIHKSLRAHVFEIEDCEFGVTMTFGISVGIQVDKIDSIITKADKRLYKGKNNGKNHTEYTD